MESNNHEPAQPIPFDPQEFGLDPNNQNDRAEVLDYAHGDLELLGLALAAREMRAESRTYVEAENAEANRLKLDKYYSAQDKIDKAYHQRLKDLGFTR